MSAALRHTSQSTALIVDRGLRASRARGGCPMAHRVPHDGQITAERAGEGRGSLIVKYLAEGRLQDDKVVRPPEVVAARGFRAPQVSAACRCRPETVDGCAARPDWRGPMPVVRGGATRTSGVYQWLRENEEAEYRRWQSTHGRAPGAKYLRWRPLEALRAGQPLSISLFQMPKWSRPAGLPSMSKTRTDMTEGCSRRSGRAVTVHADDRLMPYDDLAVPLVDDYIDP